MNGMTFTQAATLLAEVNRQATHAEVGVVATDTASFVAIAQTTLKTGYDTVINALSQTLARTLFSVRPYTRKFAGLAKTEMQYGNHVRKITICDKDPQNDPSITLPDEGSVDHYAINKPNVLQTNFYGETVFMRTLTMFKHQLDVAFSSPEEFMAFVSACVQNVVDQMEKDHENLSRAALLNFMGGLLVYNDSRVVHLLTEYNALTGLELTAQTVRKPENYPAFVKWAIARIRKVSEMLTERTYTFHTNLDGKHIPRHTPVDKQKLYLLAGDAFDMESQVLSTVFHDEYLKKTDYETVNFWQGLETPSTVSVKPSYLDSDGKVIQREQAVECEDVFGIIFDEEAIGYTVVNQWVASTPLNATGGYSNTAWHYTDRYWNDFTENGVLFVLD